MKTTEVAEESEGWFRLRTIPVAWSSDEEEGGRRGIPEDLRHKLKVIGRKGERKRERKGGRKEWEENKEGGRKERERGREGGRREREEGEVCKRRSNIMTDTDIFLCRGRRQRRKTATWTGMNHVKGVWSIVRF